MEQQLGDVTGNVKEGTNMEKTSLAGEDVSLIIKLYLVLFGSSEENSRQLDFVQVSLTFTYKSEKEKCIYKYFILRCY